MTQLKIIDNEQSQRPLFRAYLKKYNNDQCYPRDYVILFQFKHHYAEYKEPWETLSDDDYPIQVLQIDKGEPMCCDATLKAIRLKRLGYVVSHIILDNEQYQTTSKLKYWFPLIDRPADLEDGAVQLYCQDNRFKGNQSSVLLNMDNEGIPFMDLSGTFHLKGRMVAAIEMKRNVFVSCKRDVTVFSSEGKITSYLDHETHLLYSVESETTFCEMERLYAQYTQL